MCPPGVDQTERSSQTWQILAPRVQRVFNLKSDRMYLNSSHSDFTRFANSHFVWDTDWSFDAWSMLARSSPTTSDSMKTQETICHGRPGTLSKLERLPVELILAILEEPVLSKHDILAFGLASSSLWSHLLDHVEHACRVEPRAPLAGTEIACLGTYLLDLPPSFDADRLATSSVSEDWDALPEGCMGAARRYNSFAGYLYTPIVEDLEDAWIATWESQKWNVRDAPVSEIATETETKREPNLPEAAKAAGIPLTTYEKMKTELYARCSFMRDYSPTDAWVLRNHTTKQFVRCCPGDGPDKKQRGVVDHPKAEGLRLQELMMLKFRWTRVYYDNDAFGLVRGEWAGHCFDIVIFDGGDAVPTQDGWSDYTTSIVDLLMKLEENSLRLESSTYEKGLLRSSYRSPFQKAQRVFQGAISVVKSVYRLRKLKIIK